MQLVVLWELSRLTRAPADFFAESNRLLSWQVVIGSGVRAGLRARIVVPKKCWVAQLECEHVARRVMAQMLPSCAGLLAASAHSADGALPNYYSHVESAADMSSLSTGAGLWVAVLLELHFTILQHRAGQVCLIS